LWKLLRWSTRLALVSVVILLLAVIVVGVAGYKSVTRASLKRDLQQLPGCAVSYAHEYPYHEDSLPESLRERWGEDVWTDVSVVSHVDWSRDRNGLSAAEVQFICTACKSFPRLRSFSIASNHFSCELIKDWPSLETLEEVRINSNKITDSDLAIIARMRRLKTLKLSSARVTSQGIAHLARLPKLETIGFYSLEFIDAAGKPADGFKALKHLEMESCPEIGDETIIAFGTLPRVEEVILLGTAVGDRSVLNLVRGGNVKTLILQDSQVTDDGLRLVQNCSQPFFLNVQGTAITDKGLSVLTDKQLSGLVICRTGITDEGLSSLAQIQGLEYLSLSDTKLTGIGVRYFDRRTLLPSLQLDGTSLTSAGVLALAEARCTQLNLSRTFVGDNELMLFAANLDLIELNVSETKVTASGIRAFYQSRKALLAAAKRDEELMLISDYPEVVAEIRGIDPLTGERVSGGAAMVDMN
jgi:hypothetical protein